MRRVREEPVARDPVLPVARIADQIGNLAEKRAAQDLVVVDLEDPVAGAERVEPGARAFDRWRELESDQAIGDPGMVAESGLVHAGVDGDDDLVRDASELAEHGGHTRPRIGGQAADGQLHRARR